jgi:tRNA1(Val) A37 N6-methylase TrmN6
MLTAYHWVKLGSVRRANGSHVTEADITEDALLGGRIRVRQPARGYRVNVDTFLLAAAVEAPAGARLLEACAGVAAGALAVAVRSANANIVAIEREANIAALARENVALNAMSHRIEIVTGDALARGANWGVFEGVFFNPPFADAYDGPAPSPARAHAHVSEYTIDAWIGGLANMLTGGAALTLVHRAEKLGEVLAAIEGRLGGIEIVPVRPKTDAPASRVLVRARKGSRAPLRLLKGLDLHDGSGAKYTAEAEAILRGEALISWS